MGDTTEEKVWKALWSDEKKLVLRAI